MFEWVAIAGFLGILFSSIVIDLITLAIVNTKKIFKKIFILIFKIKKKIILKKIYFKVSIIIPAYNEEKNIYNVIKSAATQTILPNKIIVIDDNSSDNTLKECLRAQKDFENVKIISQKENKGKAYNITQVFKKVNLDKITIILDADTFISSDYIEKILPAFRDEKVVIVTGTSLPLRQKGFFGNLLYHGSMFTYSFFCFRKQAQSYRNAISVVTGDSAAYRTSFLNKIGGLPQGTQTEDMDVTWIALEMGNKIHYQKNALARSFDAGTLKGGWKQITRWFSGGFQCLFRHNFKLFKAKSLTFTTLIPSYIDSIIYSFYFLFYLVLFFIYPPLVIAFFIADLIFTLIAIIYLDIKYLFYLPHIYFIKLFWSLAYFYAMLKTTGEFILGKRNWGGAWERNSFYKGDKK